MTETATTSTLEPARRLPFPRSNVLEISPVYGLLRNEAPVVPVETPTGDPAWLVVAHQEAREVFADRRFGYYTHADPDAASKLTDAATHSRPMGNVEFEAEMLRLRRLLVPGFAPKRMRLLAGWIAELTDQCLDDMERAHDANPDEPVNYHDLLGWRLPVLVIGALLGVPDEDRAAVIDLSDRMGNIGDHADGAAARAELNEYMRGLVEVKRNNPGPDVISDMIAAEAEDPAFFSERPLEAYAAGLVFPGHETTVARLDFGILWLLSDTRRRDWLLADPEGRIEQTVEEILRTTSAHNLGLMRYALEDVEIGGVTVRRGALVIISEGAANRRVARTRQVRPRAAVARPPRLRPRRTRLHRAEPRSYRTADGVPVALAALPRRAARRRREHLADPQRPDRRRHRRRAVDLVNEAQGSTG